MLRRSRTEAAGSNGSGTIDLTGARILVADDHDHSAEITRRVLAREGCSVDRAQDLGDAVARLAISKPPFACAVVDFDEETSDGLKLLEAVRTSVDPEVVSIPVIICADDDTNRQLVWESGADGFLVRPFHITDLLGAVGDALARSDDDRNTYRHAQANPIS